VLPMLVLLMLNVVNFGMYMYAWVTVDNAVRALLEYRVYTGIVLGFPPSPSVTQMQNVVTAEVSSLPNSGTVTWVVCSNANGTTACEGPGATFTPPVDPVASTQYTLYSAKVWYTFEPLFSRITPLTGGVIFRQVNMRSMQ
jgi:TadE-like protein